MDAGCDVKWKSTTKKYPAFGEKLFSIVSENLPNGVVKNKSSVVTFLHQQSELSFDTSCAYAWLKGDLAGQKPLVAENFKRILLFYLGKKGLSTQEELNALIAMAPRRFEDVMSSAEIKKKLQTTKIFDLHSRQENLARRQQVWSRLLDLVLKMAAISNDRQVNESRLIIIQGPPGVGKSMFLKRLWSDSIVQARFDLILRATCDAKMSPQTFLDFCLRKLLPDEAWHPGNPIALQSDLQEAIHDKKVLILADNLSTLEEIEVLTPLCDLGCLLVVSTRCLIVARQANYSNVIELAPYSESDVREYYSKYYAAHPSLVTQEKLIQLAEMVCFNPLGLDIALRRVAEEGWETVMNKVNLAPSFMKGNVYEDLHKPFWLAYSSLKIDDQEKFRRLGILPPLASYDEERLSLLWGVSKTKANEILLRLEKEAGLAYRCPGSSCWHFHPQVLNYARYLHGERSFSLRVLSHFYPMRMAWHEKRPRQYHHMYKRGVKSEVVKKYWQMIREECKRRRMPIVLAELRRLVDPSYSTDWSVFSQLTSNCTLEDYIWGYRNYLAGEIDIWVFFIYLFLVGVISGLQSLAFHYGLIQESSIPLGIFNLFLMNTAAVWAFHIVLRDLRRRYDWGQLWQKVNANHKGHWEK